VHISAPARKSRKIQLSISLFLGLVRQLGNFSPPGSGMFTQSGCFFSGPVIVEAFFRAVREVERPGMARIFIGPDPIEILFFFTDQNFPAPNAVFRAWNDLNERCLRPTFFLQFMVDKQFIFCFVGCTMKIGEQC
jgi:hypothetical protein